MRGLAAKSAFMFVIAADVAAANVAPPRIAWTTEITSPYASAYMPRASSVKRAHSWPFRTSTPVVTRRSEAESSTMPLRGVSTEIFWPGPSMVMSTSGESLTWWTVTVPLRKYFSRVSGLSWSVGVVITVTLLGDALIAP